MNMNPIPMSFILWRQFRRFRFWAIFCWILTPLCVVAAIATASVPQLWVGVLVNITMIVGGLGCACLFEILRRRSMRKSHEYEDAAKEFVAMELGFVGQDIVGIRGADGVARMIRKDNAEKQ